MEELISSAAPLLAATSSASSSAGSSSATSLNSASSSTPGSGSVSSSPTALGSALISVSSSATASLFFSLEDGSNTVANNLPSVSTPWLNPLLGIFGALVIVCASAVAYFAWKMSSSHSSTKENATPSKSPNLTVRVSTSQPPPPPRMDENLNIYDFDSFESPFS